MDFNTLKDKVIEFKKTTFKKIDNTVEKQAERLQISKYILRKENELESFIGLSQNTEKKIDKETGKAIGASKKRVIVIFAEKDTDFYKKALYMIPVLYTKSWTQNIKFKISSLSLTKLKVYNIKETPSLVVFENKKIYKIISGIENIKKVVKSLNININDVIEKL